MYRKPERWVEDIRRAYNTKKKRLSKGINIETIFNRHNKKYGTGSVAKNMVQNIDKIVRNRTPLSAKYKDNEERRSSLSTNPKRSQILAFDKGRYVIFVVCLENLAKKCSFRISPLLHKYVQNLCQHKNCQRLLLKNQPMYLLR